MKRAIFSSLVILMAVLVYFSFREVAPVPDASIQIEVGDSLEKIRSARMGGVGPADVTCAPAQMCLLMKTFDPDVVIVGRDAWAIRGIRYLGAQSENGLITQVDGGTSLMTLDEAVARSKDWATEFERHGWKKSGAATSNLYSTQTKANFSDWADARRALFEGKDVMGLTISEFLARDSMTKARVSIEHKREDGGPRYSNSPAAKSPATEKAYQLSVSMMRAH